MSQPGSPAWKPGVLLAIVVSSALAVWALDPIEQNLSYHAFADTRTLFGIPNGLDVLSNLPFLIVGVLGLRACAVAAPDPIRHAWMALFAGVALVSLGSAYYHWSPTNDSLVFDRLPMSAGFMALFVALLGEAVDRRLVRWGLVPALLLGMASVVYWAMFEDLRPYLWVQIIPLLTIPVVMLLYRGRLAHGWWLAAALGLYLLAKGAELLDAQVYALTLELFSGHTLKHLLAAAGCYCLVLIQRGRCRPLQPV